jgi:hypothetical protein
MTMNLDFLQTDKTDGAAPKNDRRIRAGMIVWASAIAFSVGACQSNSNAGSSGNFGPNGSTSPGVAPPGYNGTGNYDPNHPPANGFKSHCSSLEPARRSNLIQLAAFREDEPSPTVFSGREEGQMLAWGSGGGGGGSGGGPHNNGPC